MRADSPTGPMGVPPTARLVDVPSDLTALGVLLEQARASLRISRREAARRAGISEAHWRQVIVGEQYRRGRAVPVTPKPRTVVAMALAVLLDPAAALTVAGLAVPVDLDRLVDDIRDELRAHQCSKRSAGSVIDLTADDHDRLRTEIAMIERMPVTESVKLLMLEALIRAWGRYAAERAARDQTD